MFTPTPQQPFPQHAQTTPTPKRKRGFSPEPEHDDDMVEMAKHIRTLPPSVAGPGGFAFPINMPDLVPDMSTSASASESDAMDYDMEEVTEPSSANYSYSEGGSGGFFFGPGAEEDEMTDEESDKGYPNLDIYPRVDYFGAGSSTAASTSNSVPVTPISPWSAQPYATNLPAPGVIQPTVAVVSEDATPTERARATHGPQCTSIPKLRMSDYPDASGERSLWAMCPDCGAMERAS